MKCIYCNSETELTSSDIITYAITGAKLTKSFVCRNHNSFTNDNYEKKFVADLDFFRNHLGFSTRDGNPIQYLADITVDGKEIHNVKISNRESLYAPKGVVAGIGDDGNKVLMAPMEKIEKISKGKAEAVDISDVIVHKSIKLDSFLGFYAIHSIAKIAYEWFCYINEIEEFSEQCKEIVEYILGNKDGNFVDIIVDKNFYLTIDQLSEIGTNAIFQYDDIDGYRYVVFDLWKTISYRVKICKTPENQSCNSQCLFHELFLYHLDGSKTKSAFSTYYIEVNKKAVFTAIPPQQIKTDICQFFINRIEKILSTIILSIYALKKKVDELSSKLKNYDAGKIDIAQLLGFEENTIITTIYIINQLYCHKDEYDNKKSFNQNLYAILDLDSDTIVKTQEDKIEYIKSLVVMDNNKLLSEYIWNGIYAFNDIYENEKNLEK